jgi:hypothetical protein
MCNLCVACVACISMCCLLYMIWWKFLLGFILSLPSKYSESSLGFWCVIYAVCDTNVVQSRYDDDYYRGEQVYILATLLYIETDIFQTLLLSVVIANTVSY